MNLIRWMNILQVFEFLQGIHDSGLLGYDAVLLSMWSLPGDAASHLRVPESLNEYFIACFLIDFKNAGMKIKVIGKNSGIDLKFVLWQTGLKWLSIFIAIELHNCKI